MTNTDFTDIPGIEIVVYEGGVLTAENKSFSGVETHIVDNNS